MAYYLTSVASLTEDTAERKRLKLLKRPVVSQPDRGVSPARFAMYLDGRSESAVPLLAFPPRQAAPAMAERITQNDSLNLLLNVASTAAVRKLAAVPLLTAAQRPKPPRGPRIVRTRSGNKQQLRSTAPSPLNHAEAVEFELPFPGTMPIAAMAAPTAAERQQSRFAMIPNATAEMSSSAVGFALKSGRSDNRVMLLQR